MHVTHSFFSIFIFLSNCQLMGCCSSTPEPVSSPVTAPTATEEVTNLPPSGENKPLKEKKKYPAWTSPEPITESAIRKKREEFWETAPTYEGRQEIWQALKAACECEDLTMAQAIVDSANVKLPNGTLTDAYDELGNRYSIPNYCLTMPTNLIVDAESSSSSTAQLASTSASASASSSSSSSANTAAAAGVNIPTNSSISASTSASSSSASASNLNINAKISSRTSLSSAQSNESVTALQSGKGSASATGSTSNMNLKTIKVRLSTSADVKVQVPNNGNIGTLKKCVADAAPNGDSTLTPERMRVFLLGKELPDTLQIDKAGIPDGGVVQILVRP